MHPIFHKLDVSVCDQQTATTHLLQYIHSFPQSLENTSQFRHTNGYKDLSIDKNMFKIYKKESTVFVSHM